MVRRIIEIDQGQVQRLRRLRRGLPRGRHRHGGRQGAAACGTTTATGWGTACPPAPPGPSPLWSGRPPPTTRAAVHGRTSSGKGAEQGMTLPCGCPGSQARTIQRADPARRRSAASPAGEPACPSGRCRSSWCPVNAPYFDGAQAADRRRLHRLRLRRLSTSGSSGATSPWWAAPSWTAWTTAKS